MKFLYANNARGQAVSALGTEATVISLQEGQGAMFPSPVLGEEAFRIRIVERAGDGTVNMEICECTFNNNDELSVERAVEPVAGEVIPTPKAFSAGAFVELVQTAGTIGALRDEITTGLNGIYEYVDGRTTVTPVAATDITLTDADTDNGVLLIAAGTESAPFNVLVPAESRRLWVTNNSTQDATVKVGADTGIVVKAGQARPVTCDGIAVYDPLTAYYTKAETYSTAQVDALIDAVESGVAAGVFTGWTGGTLAEDSMGAYYQVDEGVEASSGFFTLDYITSKLEVQLGILANQAAAGHTVYLDIYDSSDVLIKTFTILHVDQNYATTSLQYITRSLSDLSTTNLPLTAAKAKIRATVNVTGQWIRLYRAGVDTEEGIGWGTLTAGDTAELADTGLIKPVYGASLPPYYKAAEYRVAGAGTIQTQRSGHMLSGSFVAGFSTYAENLTVAAGDLIQLYVTGRYYDSFGDGDYTYISYAQVYKNGVATGTARSWAYDGPAGDQGSDPEQDDLYPRVRMQILVAGNDTTGTF